MDSIDLVAAERRARLRYEWTRARRALIGFAPVLLVVLGASALTPRPAWVWFFGLGLFAVGVVLLWYGRDLRRAVLPGVAAGLVPLILAVCANHLGHVCMGDECMTWCVPACTAGGIVAGLAVASVGLGRRSGAGFWLSASAGIFSRSSASFAS